MVYTLRTEDGDVGGGKSRTKEASQRDNRIRGLDLGHVNRTIKSMGKKESRGKSGDIASDGSHDKEVKDVVPIVWLVCLVCPKGTDKQTEGSMDK